MLRYKAKLLAPIITGVYASFLPWSVVNISTYRETVNGTMGAGLVCGVLFAIAAILVLSSRTYNTRPGIIHALLPVLMGLVLWTSISEFRAVSVPFGPPVPGVNEPVRSAAGIGLYIAMLSAISLIVVLFAMGLPVKKAK